MARISRLHYPVTVLGPGRRLGVWVQGCTLGCRGCVSRDTWDAEAGEEVAASRIAAVWSQVRADGATGITVSGGEPLQQPTAVADLLEACAATEEATGARLAAPYDVLLYTGYEPEELPGLGPDAERALSRVDAVITGRYLAGRPTDLIWRGSANQRLLPLTPLGEERYTAFADLRDAPRLQVDVDDADLRVIGIPRRGALPRLERALREAGIGIEGASWRP